LLSTAMQAIKRSVVRRRIAGREHFWQARHYDFNVVSQLKVREKLRYMHRNPVKRGLVDGDTAAIRITHLITFWRDPDDPQCRNRECGQGDFPNDALVDQQFHPRPITSAENVFPRPPRPSVILPSRGTADPYSMTCVASAFTSVLPARLLTESSRTQTSCWRSARRSC
jgi:hypothetical protein